jgi:hypothetical protein
MMMIIIIMIINIQMYDETIFRLVFSASFLMPKTDLLQYL